MAKKNETERTGFEPADPLRDHGFSKPALSTTQPPLLSCIHCTRDIRASKTTFWQANYLLPVTMIVSILDILLLVASQIVVSRGRKSAFCSPLVSCDLPLEAGLLFSCMLRAYPFSGVITMRNCFIRFVIVAGIFSQILIRSYKMFIGQLDDTTVLRYKIYGISSIYITR